MPDIKNDDHWAYAQSEEFPAKALAQEDLGKLVTITLPSGATITDILIGVGAGVPFTQRNNGGAYFVDGVRVFLENVRLRDEYGNPHWGWDLDPESPVYATSPTLEASE
jgi:hypothetical protein